jgi:hypothetical protein
MRRAGDTQRRGRLAQRGRPIVDPPALVAAARRAVGAAQASALRGMSRDPSAQSLEPDLADDLRVHHRRRDEPGRGGTTLAAVTAGRTRRFCVEEEVAHRAVAAGRAGELREDREPDRQPEAEHERQRNRERRETRARAQQGARRRQPPLVRGRSPHV